MFTPRTSPPSSTGRIDRTIAVKYATLPLLPEVRMDADEYQNYAALSECAARRCSWSGDAAAVDALRMISRMVPSPLVSQY